MNKFSLALLASLALPAFSQAASTAPAVGSVAPAFRLQDQNDQWISLADQQGHWTVLYFYPKDGTPGCTTEACEFRDNLFAFKALNATIIGISVQDVASKKEFAAKHSLPFSLLADTDRSVSTAYGVYQAVPGFAARQSFIIDPQGRVAQHYQTVHPDQHSKQVLADLATLTKAKPAN